MVNAAIHLRRPLLVTGDPGTGKSTLAYSVAYELGLGQVLCWGINSRSTLVDGLYRYDAIGRLQDAGLYSKQDTDRGSGTDPRTAIGRYLSLGPLGTALLPTDRPRVVLIDELDKGDVDLPNDLLGVLEDGEFSIPELQRLDQEVVTVMTVDGATARVRGGTVQCRAFPIIVITSNGERQFPPAFVRRCLRVHIAPPSKEKLERILQAHLGPSTLDDPWVAATICEFIENLAKPDAVLATDQLLNAVRLRMSAGNTDADALDVVESVLLPLNVQP